ncbi:hypothetical protein DMUE_0372 [Dictyocoela muelleri]|nr:hypothetical protein DMUE_0372 [Dictyocoela muelleri]
MYKKNIPSERRKNYKNHVSKYCRFKKSSSHSNEECRRKRDGQKHDNENKTYALREPRTKPRIIEIPINIRDKTFNAMIDTGSAENYIPENISVDNFIEKHSL